MINNILQTSPTSSKIYWKAIDIFARNQQFTMPTLIDKTHRDNNNQLLQVSDITKKTRTNT